MLVQKLWPTVQKKQNSLNLCIRRKMVRFDDVVDALKETIRATGKTEEEKARYEKHMVQEEKLISRMEA